MEQETLRLPKPERESTLAALSEVLRLAFPIIVALASATVMQFVDFLMVARVGTNETAAVTPAGIMVFTVIAFLIGTLSCNNTFVSQSYAKGEHSDCARYTWQAIYISVIGGALALALWPVAPELFGWIGHEPEVQSLEVVYFRIRLFSVISCAAGAGLSGFFQGIARPRIVMWVALVANGLNILLNWVLIFGHWGFPALGVAGAALGTTLAMSVQGLSLLLVFLSQKYARTYRSRRVWRWDQTRMGQLCRIGWAAGVQFSLDMACWGVFNAVIVGKLGKVPLAASNIAGQIMHLSFMPTIGLSIATTTLVGQQIGRGNLKAARARGRTAIGLGMAYMFLMGVLFMIFRRQLVALFRPEQEIIELGAKVLILAAAFQLFDAMCITCSGALKGAGDTRFPAMVQVTLAWGVFLPVSILLTYRLKMGVVGAWLGTCIFIIIFGVILLLRWRSHAWENMDIFGAKVYQPAEIPGSVGMYEPREEILEITPAAPVKPTEEA